MPVETLIIETKQIGAEQSAKQVESASRRMSAALLGIGLNSLFTGMQIQRAFTDIGRAATNTFLKITASIAPAFSTIQALGAQFEFLNFTLGAALNDFLTPFLPLITEITDAITEWISENPELAGTLVLLGIIFGAILSVGGQILLWAASLVYIFGSGGLGATIAGLIVTLKGLIGTLLVLSGQFLQFIGRILGTGLTTVLLAAGVLLVGFLALWNTGFGGIGDTVKRILGITWETIKGVFEGFKKIVGGAWDVITGLFELNGDKIIGGLLKIADGMITIFLSIAKHMGKIFVEIAAFILSAIPKIGLEMVNVTIGFAIEAAKTLIKVIDGFLRMISGGKLGLGDMSKLDAVAESFRSQVAATTSGMTAAIGTPIENIRSGLASSIDNFNIGEIKIEMPNVRTAEDAKGISSVISEDLKMRSKGIVSFG